MKIVLNHQEEFLDVKDRISIQELLDLKKYTFKLLVIKVNGQLIPRSNYAISFVKEGDDVVILHLMSGG